MDIDPDKLDQFFDATEEWNSSINMSNSMAFISQFGEYNPGKKFLFTLYLFFFFFMVLICADLRKSNYLFVFFSFL